MRAFARVVVLDDQKKHLDIIVRALGKAGFGAISYLVEDGAVIPEVREPCNGLRLIFSDIHLTPTSGISGIDNIGILGPFLRNITSDGPYGLIFWSKFAEDEAEIVQTLKDRADDLGIQLPVFFGFIDKNTVLTDLDDEAEEVEETTPDNFKNLILAEVAKCPTLRAVMEWEERAFLAANSVSNSLFKISENSQGDIPTADSWLNLISYLAQEAVGRENAKNDPLRAIDNALLPILEDQFRYSLPSNASDAFDQIKEKLSGGKLSLPAGVSAAKLHSYYLVENLTDAINTHNLRGTISAINEQEFDDFFSRCFASKWRSLMLEEFIVQGPDRVIFQEARKIPDLPSRISPCLISLSPECDDVQGKVVTQRYLLGVTLNPEDSRFCVSEGKLARDALHSIGTVDYQGTEKLIIVSCRRFLAIPTVAIRNMPLTPILRLRRTMIDELSHQYTTYTRRPGVMRFS
jgi:hypothetical protein